MAPLGKLDIAEVQEVAARITTTAQDQGTHKASLEKLSIELNRLCSLHDVLTDSDEPGQPKHAAVSEVASAVDECVQYLDEMVNGDQNAPDDHPSNSEIAAGGLERCSRNLIRVLGDALSIDAEPPSYDAATDSGSISPAQTTHRTPYSDDKRSPLLPQQSHIRATGSSQRPQRNSRYIQKAEVAIISHPFTDTNSAPTRPSTKWKGFAKSIACIAPTIAPGEKALRTRCFASGSQLRLAIVTGRLLQAYDAARDLLLWELHGNSSQLVQGNEEPLEFGEGFRSSPDGTLLCVVASRKSHKRLLIIDSQSGWIKMEYLLSSTDGNKPHISQNNAMAVICNSGTPKDRNGQLKVFSLLPEDEGNKPKSIPFDKPASSQGISLRFAPDNYHIITCAGPTSRSSAAPSVTVSVYDLRSSSLVRTTSIPCSEAFNNNSHAVKFAADFHFPSANEWLVSFPDYSGPRTTRIVNARLGQTVAAFTPELSLSQRWQVGVLAPGKVQVAYDKETGIFTRVEASTTMVPRGQALTICKFTLSAGGGREKAAARKPYQIKVSTMTCKASDSCGLTADGGHLFIQGSAKIDVLSLAL